VSHPNATHGQSKTKDYSRWRGMHTRCYNANHETYPKYGARGIRVCERWHTFENFLADMGNAPTAEHSIERINNDGNYEPGNCRWATTKEQARNRRSSRYLEHDGERLTVAEWAERMGVSAWVIENRLRRGWPTGRIFEPPRQKPAQPMSNNESARRYRERQRARRHADRAGHELEAAGV
jgi:hypothetical protein